MNQQVAYKTVLPLVLLLEADGRKPYLSLQKETNRIIYDHYEKPKSRKFYRFSIYLDAFGMSSTRVESEEGWKEVVDAFTKEVNRKLNLEEGD